MKTFFIVVSISTISLFVMQILKYYVGKVKGIYSQVKKRETVVFWGITLAIALIPFVLLFIAGDLTTLGKIVRNFIGSLFVSAIFAFTVGRISHSIFRSETRTKDSDENKSRGQVTRKGEVDWKTKIEQETLERFGLNSTVGISFISLNRLGNQLSELVVLEQEIDSLETDKSK